MKLLNLAADVVVIQIIAEVFGEIVFRDRLPVEDSYVTSITPAIVVREYSSTSEEVSCDVHRYNDLIEVDIFDRGECNNGTNLPSGYLEAMDRTITQALKSYEGKRIPGGILIEEVSRNGHRRKVFPEETLIRHRIRYQIYYY